MKPTDKFKLGNGITIFALLALSCSTASGQETEPQMDTWYNTPLWTQLAAKPKQPPETPAAQAPSPAVNVTASSAPAAEAANLAKPEPQAVSKKKIAKLLASKQTEPTTTDPLSNPAADNDFPEPRGMAVEAAATHKNGGGSIGSNLAAKNTGKVRMPWYKNIYLRAEYGQDSFSKQKSRAANGSSIGHTFKRSPVWGGGLGYKFNEFFRADVSYQGRSIDGTGDYIKKGKQTAWFVNAYGMLMDEGYLRPYLTAGIGHAKTKFKQVNSGPSNATTGYLNKTAWNVGVGLAIQLQEQVALTIGYRYLDFGKLTRVTTATALKPSFDVRLRAQEVVGGVVFSL